MSVVILVKNKKFMLMRPNSIQYSTLLLACLLLILNSCRTEEMEFIESPPENTLAANSNVAALMQRTSLNDGSNDNIVDQANCFNIQFPFTVIVNGNEIVVNSEQDFEDIEDILDEFEDDNDTVVIQFPVTIILADFTEIVINNESELDNYAEDCNDENEFDDDIECLDFQYPITASIFNTNNELIDTISITSDNELHDFIEDLNDTIIASIQFPITVILLDGTVITIENLMALETIIEQYSDTCDEDDDYDYNDDDCNNCTPDLFITTLTDCSPWIIDKLERNDEDLEDNYIGYDFTFYADNTIEVVWGGSTAYGTWSASGTGNNIEVIINIPGLPDCNANWLLHEIEEEPGETKIDLRLNNDDRMVYESDCN